MKTRTYTIITGDYENTHVVGRIVGPAAPALSTLLKRFKEKYNYKDSRDPVRFYETICKQHEAIDRMKADGLVGWDLAELFIRWCVREHKFKLVETDVFYL